MSAKGLGFGERVACKTVARLVARIIESLKVRYGGLEALFCWNLAKRVTYVIILGSAEIRSWSIFKRLLCTRS